MGFQILEIVPHRPMRVSAKRTRETIPPLKSPPPSFLFFPNVRSGSEDFAGWPAINAIFAGEREPPSPSLSPPVRTGPFEGTLVIPSGFAGSGCCCFWSILIRDQLILAVFFKILVISLLNFCLRWDGLCLIWVSLGFGGDRGLMSRAWDEIAGYFLELILFVGFDWW